MKIKYIDCLDFCEDYLALKHTEGNDFQNFVFDKIPKDNQYFISTIISGDDETTYISPGIHVVNREGYLLTILENETEYCIDDLINYNVAKYKAIRFIESLEDITEEKKEEYIDKIHREWDTF